MRNGHMTVLLADDDVATARLLHTLCAETPPGRWQVTHVRRLSTAVQYLARQQFDVVLLDLHLPDGRGLDTLRTLRAQAPSVPVVVLAQTGDEVVATQAMQEGAQDYIVKTHMQSPLLLHVLRCTIELHTLLHELHLVSPSDMLTGLYNRQGFLTLAAQQLRYARRYRQHVLLFVLTLENLAQINTTLGREVGDQVLCEVADVLQDTLRQSDIIARLDGTTFAVLAPASEPQHAELCMTRISTRMQERDITRDPASPLRLHIRHAWYNPDSPVTLYELLREAKITPSR